MTATVAPAAAHPLPYARAAGIGYLLIILSGIYAEFFVRGSMLVAGDPAATAQNIAASAALFRTGIAAEFVMLTADILVAAALFVVFRKVQPHLALLAAFFRVAHAAVVAANLLNTYVPLRLVTGQGQALDSPLRAELASVLLDAHGYGYAVGLVFFAMHCGVLGYLVWRSTFAPRVLGWLLMLAGAGYLTDSFARTLMASYDANAGWFALVVFVPAFIAELSFCVWLLVRGGRRLAQPRPALHG